jgi:AcrR family transcriptional regulator
VPTATSRRPRTRPRTTKSAEQVRADLLAAAAQLFASRGFSEVAIADIAEAAGVATGTFYRYFPSKDDVLVQLGRTVMDEILALVEPPEPGAEPVDAEQWWDGAIDTVEATVTFWFHDRDRSRVVLRGGFSDDAVDVEARIGAGFAEGLRRGQELGAVDPDLDPVFAANFIMHGAFGLVYHAICDEDRPDPDRLVTEVTRLVRHLLEPQRPRR